MLSNSRLFAASSSRCIVLNASENKVHLDIITLMVRILQDQSVFFF